MSKQDLNESFLRAVSASKKRKGPRVSSETLGALGVSRKIVSNYPPSILAYELGRLWKEKTPKSSVKIGSAETKRQNSRQRKIIARLDALPKKQALATLYYLIDYLGKGESTYEQNVLGRMLSDRVF